MLNKTGLMCSTTRFFISLSKKHISPQLIPQKVKNVRTNGS